MWAWEGRWSKWRVLEKREGFWRSARLTSNPDDPAGGKERAFFSRSVPRSSVWHSHGYSGFGELLRPSKTRGKRKVEEVPHLRYGWTGLGWIFPPRPAAAQREAESRGKYLFSPGTLPESPQHFWGVFGETAGRTVLYSVF